MISKPKIQSRIDLRGEGGLVKKNNLVFELGGKKVNASLTFGFLYNPLTYK